jgi:hypothetical protein
MLETYQTKAIGDVLALVTNLKDLAEVSKLIANHRDQLRMKAAMGFARGQIVQFQHKGFPITGTIKSVNRKTVTLEKCSDKGPGWRVHFASVEAINALEKTA